MTVIEDLVKQTKAKRKIERRSTRENDSMPDTGKESADRPAEGAYKSRIFGRKRVDTYYGRRE